jgi:hypothetical protein
MGNDDRYEELLFNLIPKLENRILGIKALNTTNSRTGNKFVQDIFADLYPKSPLNDKAVLEINSELIELANEEYLSLDRLNDELVEAANISEHIKEYNKSYELTLSESMKDFLAHVAVNVH